MPLLAQALLSEAVFNNKKEGRAIRGSTLFFVVVYKAIYFISVILRFNN